MPSYYGRDILRHAEKKFLQRKAREAEQKKRRDCPSETTESGKKE